MKTYQKFLEEATKYEKYPHFSSKDELISHYKGIPHGFVPKQRGTSENPKWGLSYVRTQDKASKKREENIKIATGKLTPRESLKVDRKRKIRTQRGMDLHHATGVEHSGEIMRNMSPGERLRYKTAQRKENKFHGDDPRNLVLANRGPVSEFKPEKPGFHHGAYHAFERRHRGKLKDVENAITPMRAFTTLVNLERRQSRRDKLDKERRGRTLPKLQARMAAAAKRHGIEND
jgi:hypothetical protein